ncbi:EutN/CcmL family microcompartment protein [Fusobacterium sp. IOR10]|uniref:EutN/CcmL family microcompartment protein n=1 Tax=Fusobacterium sp. IOR10 TaxID=2665157 RepID=UPI0013D0CE23|nr:EutN/CcmL family microcompartment protein [Fusobacterium sp. IOR10]
MYIAKVIGNVVSTSKNEKLIGSTLLIIKRLDENKNPIGLSEIALDTVGAGTGEIVIVASGSSARLAVKKEEIPPVDLSIIGIVDSVEVNDFLE